MNKISVTTIFAIILITLGAQAQSEQDVLRYSFTNVVGSARSMACGNAFGALGADYSSLVSNPAGLARYRNSELGITTNFFNTQANTFYIDNKRTDNSFNININNLGLAVALPTENTSGWRYVNIGFGVSADTKQALTIDPGSFLTISSGPVRGGSLYNMSNIWLDVSTANDGVVIFYER